MNAERLLQHFERISEAPDAIPSLRQFILDLAVRGKLVEQDPNDEPASELLKHIQRETERLFKVGEIERQDILPPIAANEVPFAVPKGWGPVRLGESLHLINGRAFKPSEWTKSGLPIIRIQNLNNADAPFNYCDAPMPEKVHVKAGDFLISWSGTPGSSFGAHIWDRGPAILNQHIFRAELIGTAFVQPFLKLAINSRLFELIEQAHGGVGLQHITKPKLEKLPLTLPPLVEQRRIVAKVDALMALCDQLEAAKTEREQSRDRLVAASLYRLNFPTHTAENGAPDLPGEQADTFYDHARFVFNYLPQLTTRPEHIKQLRQTILNLAVRGKLVSQDPNDESVDKLLDRVTAERQGLSAKGRLKAQKAFVDVDADPPSQPIPATWRWMQLADLISFGPQNGISPKPTNNTESPKALTLTATTSGFFDASYYKHVDLREVDCQNYWLSTGDVLFQRGNTREYVGIAAVFDGPEKSFVFPDLMIRVRFAEALSLRFIHMTLISPLLRRYFAVEATGASASMPKISQGVLLNAPIPLPPLAEQHRIVAKVDDLMALCDQLEAQLTAAEADSRRLLEAVLHEALNPLAEVAAQLEPVADRANAPQN